MKILHFNILLMESDLKVEDIQNQSIKKILNQQFYKFIAINFYTSITERISFLVKSFDFK